MSDGVEGDNCVELLTFCLLIKIEMERFSDSVIQKSDPGDAERAAGRAWIGGELSIHGSAAAPSSGQAHSRAVKGLRLLLNTDRKLHRKAPHRTHI